MSNSTSRVSVEEKLKRYRELLESIHSRTSCSTARARSTIPRKPSHTIRRRMDSLPPQRKQSSSTKPTPSPPPLLSVSGISLLSKPVQLHQRPSLTKAAAATILPLMKPARNISSGSSRSVSSAGSSERKQLTVTLSPLQFDSPVKVEPEECKKLGLVQFSSEPVTFAPTDLVVEGIVESGSSKAEVMQEDEKGSDMPELVGMTEHEESPSEIVNALIRKLVFNDNDD